MDVDGRRKGDARGEANDRGEGLKGALEVTWEGSVKEHISVSLAGILTMVNTPVLCFPELIMEREANLRQPGRCSRVNRQRVNNISEPPQQDL